MKPKARKGDLLVKRDTGELIIEDLTREKGIHLNPTSAYVWEKCDGKRDTEEIAKIMENELGMNVSEKVVAMAVNKLFDKNLLEDNLQAA